MEDAHSLPGTDLLRQAASFGMPDLISPVADSKPLPPISKLGPRGGGGGIGSAGNGKTSASSNHSPTSSPISDEEFYGTPTLGDHNPEPVADPVEEKPQAECLKIGWCAAETKFETNAGLFAEFKVPDSEKGRTLVDFELLRQINGEFTAVETSQGHCDESGRACAIVPIRKPKTESTLESTFAIRVKHCTAKDQAWVTKKETERVVKETAEEFFEHEMVSGLHFLHNKSFIPGSYIGFFKQLEVKFDAWRKKYSDGKVFVFGHAEKDEKGPRELSQRRASIAAAFMLGDYQTWVKMAETESWGCWEQQSVLKALGFLEDSEPSGKYDDPTRTAAEKFINWLNKNEGKQYNPKLGLTESYIREDLYRLYVTGTRRKVRFLSEDFKLVAGNTYVGCGCINRYMASDVSRPENRRATVLLIAERENFPKAFPCKGVISPCEQEISKPGKRRFEGFRCKFYDDLAVEEKAGVRETLSTPIAKSQAFDIDAAVAHLDAHAHASSQGKCATYVREALEAGGLDLTNRPVHAKDYGHTLKNLGFQEQVKTDYLPQKGDLAVFQSTSRSVSGHIQMFNGKNWASDFVQTSPNIYPGPTYRKEQTEYAIYRYSK